MRSGNRSRALVPTRISANQLLAPTSEDRRSTITALTSRDGKWFALACGHGTLPIANAQIVRWFDTPADGFGHRAHDISSGDDFDAQLSPARSGLSSTGRCCG